MKGIILFIAAPLIACGPTTLLTVNPAANIEDTSRLQRAVGVINEAAGCDLVQMDVGTKSNFNVDFSSDNKCDAELVNASSASFTLLGITDENPLAAEASMCLTSFAQAPLLWWNDYTSGPIYQTDISDEIAIHTYLHESGHMMGLEHTKNPDDIMYYTVYYDKD